ncbi:MAG: hypothetical protein QOG91_133 [Candidatus Parcubacteria bacterium]|nr:hypothetical protein [Candidatus Parcubacteria bacterium]
MTEPDIPLMEKDADNPIINGNFFFEPAPMILAHQQFIITKLGYILDKIIFKFS